MSVATSFSGATHVQAPYPVFWHTPSSLGVSPYPPSILNRFSNVKTSVFLGKFLQSIFKKQVACLYNLTHFIFASLPSNFGYIVLKSITLVAVITKTTAKVEISSQRYPPTVLSASLSSRPASLKKFFLVFPQSVAGSSLPVSTRRTLDKTLFTSIVAVVALLFVIVKNATC